MVPKEIEQARIQLGTLVFSQEFEAQFVSSSAGLFQREWFEFVSVLPPGAKNAVRAWDKASTPGGGDYSTGVLMVRHQDTYYVADVVRGQWSCHQRNQIIERTSASDASASWSSLAIWIEQEPGSGGRESAEFTIRQLAGHNIRAERPTGDKATRAQPLAAQCEAGNVKLVRGEWNRDFLNELEVFPLGRFDDQVDASSMAFIKLTRMRTNKPSWSFPYEWQNQRIGMPRSPRPSPSRGFRF